MRKNLKKLQNEAQDKQVSKKQEAFNLKREIEKLPNVERALFEGARFHLIYGGPFRKGERRRQYDKLVREVQSARLFQEWGSGKDNPPEDNIPARS